MWGGKSFKALEDGFMHTVSPDIELARSGTLHLRHSSHLPLRHIYVLHFCTHVLERIFASSTLSTLLAFSKRNALSSLGGAGTSVPSSEMSRSLPQPKSFCQMTQVQCFHVKYVSLRFYVGGISADMADIGLAG